MAKFARRLQRIGSSILVSLPKEWVESNSLEKGSQVEIETGTGSATITAGAKRRPAKELAISYPLPPDENITADITGGYLLGYDAITVRSSGAIPGEDREKVRGAMRRLVGMEIVEEDASAIQMQFLLDAATVSPEKILQRISSIASGMYSDILMGLISSDSSDLAALQNRDLEINRQYFLLVRLIRSTMIDARLAGTFNLENIDILDYRVAASLLERGGDALVELGRAVMGTDATAAERRRLYNAAKGFEEISAKSIDAFVRHDRPLAIEAIAGHRRHQEGLSALRGGRISMGLLDLAYRFERVARSWEDVVDLVKPVYADPET